MPCGRRPAKHGDAEQANDNEGGYTENCAKIELRFGIKRLETEHVEYRTVCWGQWEIDEGGQCRLYKPASVHRAFVARASRGNTATYTTLRVYMYMYL